MKPTPQGRQDAELETKLKEADVYYSMGLVDEAIEAYRGILSSNYLLTGEQKTVAEERLRELEGKGQGQAGETQNGLELAQQVIVTTEGLASEGNIQAILDGAFALRELGLYDEAVGEYVKLFSLDYPPDKVVSEICKCLLRSSTPSRVKEDVCRIIDDYVEGESARAAAKFRLGLEMEKINKLQFAMELYEEASLLSPEDRRIKERIEYLTKKHVPKKQKSQESVSLRLKDVKEKRKWERINARIPQFVFVEFELESGDAKRQKFKLNVANYSKYGLGLVVPQEQKELLKLIKPGSEIHNMTFFARWAVIRVDALVRHITEVDTGPYKGQHIVGVESDEIIESSAGL